MFKLSKILTAKKKSNYRSHRGDLVLRGTQEPLLFLLLFNIYINNLDYSDQLTDVTTSMIIIMNVTHI